MVSIRAVDVTSSKLLFETTALNFDSSLRFAQVQEGGQLSIELDVVNYVANSAELGFVINLDDTVSCPKATYDGSTARTVSLEYSPALGAETNNLHTIDFTGGWNSELDDFCAFSLRVNLVGDATITTGAKMLHLMIEDDDPVALMFTGALGAGSSITVDEGTSCMLPVGVMNGLSSSYFAEVSSLTVAPLNAQFTAGTDMGSLNGLRFYGDSWQTTQYVLVNTTDNDVWDGASTTQASITAELSLRYASGASADAVEGGLTAVPAQTFNVVIENADSVGVKMMISEINGDPYYAFDAIEVTPDDAGMVAALIMTEGEAMDLLFGITSKPTSMKAGLLVTIENCASRLQFQDGSSGQQFLFYGEPNTYEKKLRLVALKDPNLSGDVVCEIKVSNAVTGDVAAQVDSASEYSSSVNELAFSVFVTVLEDQMMVPLVDNKASVDVDVLEGSACLLPVDMQSSYSQEVTVSATLAGSSMLSIVEPALVFPVGEWFETQYFEVRASDNTEMSKFNMHSYEHASLSLSPLDLLRVCVHLI